MFGKFIVYGFFIFICNLFVLNLAAEALPAEVHVSLFQGNTSLSKIIIDGPYSCDERSGAVTSHGEFFIDRYLTSKDSHGLIRHHNGKVVVRPAGGPLLISSGNKQRHYRGRFVITSERGKLRIVNIVESKAYITSVVGSESLPDFPLEALKAQAVLATSVLARRAGHSFYNLNSGSTADNEVGANSDQGIIGDTTEVQAYLGSEYERPLVKQAADAVFGQELKNKNGFTAAVFYHSTCAGGTSDAREIFSGKLQKGAASSCVKCSFCRPSPFYKVHRANFSLSQVKEKLGYLPLSIEKVDGQRRPLQVKIEKSDGGIFYQSGYALWLKIGQKLGWDVLPGMRYSFSKENQSIIFKSTGAGHGAGLCQWGAAAMAEGGKSYREILKYYFPDCNCSAGDR